MLNFLFPSIAEIELYDEWKLPPEMLRAARILAIFFTFSFSREIATRVLEEHGGLEDVTEILNELLSEGILRREGEDFRLRVYNHAYSRDRLDADTVRAVSRSIYLFYKEEQGCQPSSLRKSMDKQLNLLFFALGFDLYLAVQISESMERELSAAFGEGDKIRNSVVHSLNRLARIQRGSILSLMEEKVSQEQAALKRNK